VNGTGAAARFYDPVGIASDGAGNLYVADSVNDAIRKVVIATGAVTTLAGQMGQSGSANGRGTAARFNNPRGVASDGAGNLYVADTNNGTIRRIVIATGAVTTFAGAAGATAVSADGTGAAARFLQANAIAADGAGNLYVADANAIRRIIIATRAVTTLAGTASLPGGTDGTGPDGLFNTPAGLAADAAGNVYVTDTNNSTVRKVVAATGVVTTLAGTSGEPGTTDGTGAAARFYGPGGMVLDGAGNLYVADSTNNTVRQVVIASAAVTTLAGAAGALPNASPTFSANSLSDPMGIASDGAGNLYIVDTNSGVILKIVIATGDVSTFAGGSSGVYGDLDGTGTGAGFYNPHGITSDGAGTLYVADTGGETIRRIDVATGAVTTIAGMNGQIGSSDGTGTNATFYSPSGVVADGAGNLYVTDTGNFSIRKIVIATGAVTTIAGTPTRSGFSDGTGADAFFAQPNGITTDGAGNLYVADGSNGTIRKIVAATAAVTTLAGTANEHGTVDGTGADARFQSPWGITYDGAGNLYVADTNSTIRKVVIATGAVTTVAGAPGAVGTADGTGAAARFNGCYGIASDGAGTLYVADTYNNAIRKIAAATGTVTTIAGAPPLLSSGDGIGPLARFTSLQSVAGDGAGNVFVTDGNDTLRKIVIATRSVTTFAGAPGQQGDVDGLGVDARFTRPTALFGDGTSNLYIVDSNTMRRVVLPAGAVTTVANGPDPRGNTQFIGATDIVSDGAGNLYVADDSLDDCDCVRKIVVATGAVTILAGSPYDTIADGTGTDAHFAGPRGITADGSGNLYVTDNTTIRQIVIATGVVTTLVGMAYQTGSTDGVGTAALFNQPAGIASDGIGNLYVADGNAIRKIVVSTATVSTVIGAAGQVGVGPGALPATLNAPVDVTVLPTGELAIVDAVEKAVLIGHL
jgi:hypothetical protein